jgi:hypothetical protein
MLGFLEKVLLNSSRRRKNGNWTTGSSGLTVAKSLTGSVLYHHNIKYKSAIE